MSHIHIIIKLIYFFVKGERQGWLEISDVHHHQVFVFLSLSGKSLPPSVFSSCVFKVLVQTEVPLLPLRSGRQTDESTDTFTPLCQRSGV